MVRDIAKIYREKYIEKATFSVNVEYGEEFRMLILMHIFHKTDYSIQAISSVYLWFLSPVIRALPGLN